MNDAKREGQILIEQHLAESRVILEATPANKDQSFFALLTQLRETSRCPKCGGSAIVANVAGRGYRAEKVTAKTHCVCPGGPVDMQTKGALNTLEGAK